MYRKQELVLLTEQLRGTDCRFTRRRFDGSLLKCLHEDYRFVQASVIYNGYRHLSCVRSGYRLQSYTMARDTCHVYTVATGFSHIQWLETLVMCTQWLQASVIYNS